jgi:hypothetical protein
MTAAASFIIFVGGWGAAMTVSPQLEHSGKGTAMLVVSCVALIIVELVQYHRFRSALARLRFLRRHAGAVFVVGTSRKGWHPLFNGVFRLPAAAQSEWVWWRDRAVSPLDALQLQRPPVDLPFAVIVGASDVRYMALGSSLRRFCRRPLRPNIELAYGEIVAVTSRKTSAGAR